MRLTTKLFVSLAVVAVSLFAINSGNQASADDIPASTNVLIVDLTTDFLGSQVVLTGTMTVESQAQNGTDPILCEMVAMELHGTYLGTALTVTAGSNFGISPSFCTITEQQGPTFVLWEFLAQVFLEVDAGSDGSVDALNCDNEPIPFGATLLEFPPDPGNPAPISFGPTNAITATGVPLCDPEESFVGAFAEFAFVGGAAPVPPPGPPAVGGVVGLSAEDGSPAGSESSSSASAMTLLLLGAGFVTIVALATGGWYLRRRLIP